MSSPFILTGRKTAPPLKPHPYSPLLWTKPQPNGARGLKLYEWKGMNTGLRNKVLSVPWGFFNICHGVDDEDIPVQFRARDHQIRGFLLAHKYRWTYYTKYRQAQYSTWIALGMLLRDCMYFSGMKGLLVAHEDEAVEDLFERITLCYKIMRDKYGYDIVVPLDKTKNDPSAKTIHFEHGGSIKCITGGGFSPGTGRSIARLHFTETGELNNRKQAKTLRSLMPTVSRRKNARIWWESTPGDAGCPVHTTWIESLDGGSYFSGDRGTPCFLEWWLDPTCRVTPPAGFTRTKREEEYIRTLAGGPGRIPGYATKLPDGTLVGNLKSGSFNPALEIDDAYLQFRRLEISTTFDKSPRKFDNKFPAHPLSGWRSSENPVLPEAHLTPLLGDAPNDEQVELKREAGMHWMKAGPPDKGRCYLLTADPKRMVEGADPAGHLVFEVTPKGVATEVGFWQGWDDPYDFSDRIVDAINWLQDEAEYYVDDPVAGIRRPVTDEELSRLQVTSEGDIPLAAIESNVDSTIILVMRKGEDEDVDETARRDISLFHTRARSGGHPGWYNNSKTNKDSITYTIKGLKEGTLVPVSKGTIMQAIAWDGSRKDRRSTTATGGHHHYERARCLLMAGHVAATHTFFFAKYHIVPDRSHEEYVPIALRGGGVKKQLPYNPLLPASQQNDRK